MRRIALLSGFAAASLYWHAPPAAACSFSRPVFTADPAPDRRHELRVRVDLALVIGGREPRAVRATVLDDGGLARRGDVIVVVLPDGATASCYYIGLADPAAIARNGSIEGYVALNEARDATGAFSSWLAEEGDRRRYAAYVEGRLRGRWVHARFTSGGEVAR